MLEPEPEPEPLAAPVDEWTVVQRKPVKAGKKKKKARGRRQAGGQGPGRAQGSAEHCGCDGEHGGGAAEGVSPDAVLTSRDALAADIFDEQQVQRAVTQMQHAADSVRHQPHCRACAL